MKIIKDNAKKAFKEIKEAMPNFNQHLTPLEEVQKFLPSLNKKYQKKIIGNLINRDITIQAKNLIFNSLFDENYKKNKYRNDFYIKLGDLLNNHHYQLKENIEVSTDKIEKMISNCLELGALGAKINGSGFGGTMFAFFPHNEDLLIKSIKEAGGEAFIIKTSDGVEIY